MPALAPTAPMRRGRFVHVDAPALTTGIAGGGAPSCRALQRGVFGKRSCNGRGPGFEMGVDV